MTLRPFIALGLVVLSQTVVANADACGVPEPEDTIARHFNALNAHDRTRMLAQWNEGAPVVTVGEPTTIEPVDRAATRWLASKESLSFRVDKLDETDSSATAIVTVTSGGKNMQDTILLTSARGQWRIAGMTIATPAKAASAY